MATNGKTFFTLGKYGRLFFAYGVVELLLLVSVCFVSCLYTKHDIHITLDIRHVRETATSIEDVVSGEKDLEELEQKQGALADLTARSVAWLGVFDPAGSAVAAPGEFEIREVTDTLKKAIGDRKERYDEVSKYKAQGLIGEANDAELAPRPELEKADKELAEKVKKLVKEENADRLTIYREIARQNKAEDAESLSKIRRAWAAVHREKSRKGDWVQAPETKEFYGKFLEEPMARKLEEKPRPGAWFQAP